MAELCLLACPVLSPAEGLGSDPSSLTMALATFQSWGPTGDMERVLVPNIKAEPRLDSSCDQAASSLPSPLHEREMGGLGPSAFFLGTKEPSDV